MIKGQQAKALVIQFVQRAIQPSCVLQGSAGHRYRQEGRAAKLASMTVKLGALVFVLVFQTSDGCVMSHWL